MGFFKALANAIESAAEEQGRKEERYSGHSAIGSGRMHVTDRVKGSDSPIPHSPGVYRHVNKATGNVDYVGQSNDIRTRQQQHVRSGQLNTETQEVWFSTGRPDCTKDDLCNTEKAHIGKHHPTGNKTQGGNGRR